ncbi:MAG: M20/M25/M40 family metallo-hydrolase [Deltaproteobacteria bacterium]|nr:M20/M25/M40 family metallo-hydrolase [Deltaproteobacteria bacterium]
MPTPTPAYARLSPKELSDLHGEATALFQELLRLDTSNPPGDEIIAARALQRTLEADDLNVEILEAAPGRANLLCRLPAAEATGQAPLLIAGHLDVVPAGDESRWTHPPFAGTLADGYLWGRGAVDMKNMVTMGAMVMKLLARRDVPLTRDIIFAAVADEEEGCTHGSRFLVETYPDKVRAGFALGEVGGFPQQAGKARVMPVQIAEKGVAWLRATTHGTPGHGAIPRADSAPNTLARALFAFATKRLPQHNTPAVAAFIRQIAKLQPLPDRLVLPRLLQARLAPTILDRVMPSGDATRIFDALLHNTVSPTVLRAGEKTNVIPDTASVELDGRLLPGETAASLIAELRDLLSDDLRNAIDFSVLHEGPAATNYPPDSPLWRAIGRAVARRGERALPVVPTMIPGFTDGAQFSRLGTRWYGFSPVWLDLSTGITFSELVHGVDERIPEDGFHWGLDLLWEVVVDFCAG